MAGIADPLRLSSLHHLLDVMEMILIEGMGTSNEIQRYYYRTYKPDPADAATSTFTMEESEDSFSAFTAALGDMH